MKTIGTSQAKEFVFSTEKNDLRIRLFSNNIIWNNEKISNENFDKNSLIEYIFSFFQIRIKNEIKDIS